MSEKVQKFILLAVGVLVMSILISYLVFAWTEPSQNPPGGNVPAPINVGPQGQAKQGGLILNTGGASTGLIVQYGNVGIGTTAPSFKLDVSGDVRWTGTLQGGSVPWARLTNFPSACPSGQFVTAVGTTLTCASPPSGGIGGSGTTNYIAKFTGSTTIGNSLIYDNGTNVGIGTWSPSYKLTVSGGDIYGSNNLYIAGNVGIGTTAPSYKLHVQGGDIYSSGYVRGGTGLCIGSDCRTSWPSGGGGGVSGSGSTNYVAKWTGSTSIGNSIIYDNGTNVGIGTTAPLEKLDVAGAIKVGNTSSPCDANHRGVIKFIPGEAGVADHLAVCEKNAAGNYAWVYIGSSVGGFKYRKPVTINNTQNTNTLTDYQVLVTLDTASLISTGKMRSDCGDIRFTDTDGVTNLNYWIESGCNTATTKIWVKVPFIPASSTKTIYVYYGNPSATSLSNGINTFLAFSLLKFDGPFGGRTSVGGLHTCALLSDGTAKCWGYNGNGQLGDGTVTSRNTPVTVSGLTNAVAIATGGDHTCALLSDGTAKCWGFNGAGQLGDGTTTDKRTPVTFVSDLTNAVAIATGGVHTCALLSDGTAKCWGYNYYGQLGDGTNTSKSTPVTVSGLTNAVAIATGGLHTCALLSDGTVKCWGYNYYGQLGDGTNTDKRTPVTVSGLTNAVAIAAGYYHTCALLSDGTAKCWGHNVYGQLGDGTNVGKSTPVTVSGLTNAVAIAAGYYHTCALLSDGTVKCWGYNYYGQLGDGTTTDKRTPVTVSGLTNAVAIAAGYYHTCALLSDGTAKCWGRDSYGQLGDGTNVGKSTPVNVLYYNLGGRYDKTNGIPATIQKPPYFQDTYFIRKYTFPEPTTSVGAEYGADIAEYYPVEDLSIEPGDLVRIKSGALENLGGILLDGNYITEKYLVEKTTKLYDPLMIGVISKSPAMTLGEGGENKRPVALVGKVPVKVTTKNGEIKVGDYLTSSDIPGVAMKATKPGRVIGIALESYSGPPDQIGWVTVFLNPHFALGTINNNGDFEELFKQIENASTTKSETSVSILEKFISLIKSALEKLGIWIEGGIVKIKTLFVENLKIGSPEKPIGITIYDEDTGQPYCVKIKSGQLINIPGECSRASTTLATSSQATSTSE